MIKARDPAAAHPCIQHRCEACCWDTTLSLLDEDVARLENAGKRGFTVMDRQGYLRLRTVDGHCVFLGSSGCRVYDERPDGCRVYPAVYYELEDEVDWDEFCPFRESFGLSPGIALRVLRGVWIDDRQALLRRTLGRRGSTTLR